MVRKYRSRLERIEREKKARSALFFFLFSITLVCLTVFLGIPFIIYLSSFVSEFKSPQEIIQKTDEIPPQPPIFTTANMATFSAQIDIKGYAEPGTTVLLAINDSDQETVVDSDGYFLFEEILLEEGENTIQAVAIDQAGNESQPSKSLLIVQDREPPELLIESTEDEAVVSEERIAIVGQTEKGAILTINGQRVILDSEGKFNYPLRLSEGENRVLIIARDAAGNESKIEKKVEYRKE